MVVPVFNEQDSIYEMYVRLNKTMQKLTISYEFIFVDDGSKDASLEKILEIAKEDDCVNYVSFSRNFGHQAAIWAGLEHAVGEAIVFIDGDLQDPPEVIEQLYKKHLEGFDVVTAKRKSREGESMGKKVTAKYFYRLLSRITNIDIPLDTGDFRIISAQVGEQLKNLKEHNKFIRGQIAWLGFSSTQIEFDRKERKYGETGYSLGKMLRFAMDGITGFSNLPLKLASYLGFLVSIIAFFLIMYALFSKFILKETEPGWTSSIIATMFIGGIQLLCIGILGEYISRIHNNIKNRPTYIVKNKKLRD